MNTSDKRPRFATAALIVTACAVTAITLPAPASAAEPGAARTSTHTEITIPMIPTCAPEFPDCDLSGADTGGGTARGALPGTCGTSSIYVDKIGTHKGRVSWGMHINSGFMVSREISVAWGSAGAGSFADVSAMYTTNYSNSRTVSGTGNLSATIGGAVQLVGNKYVHCTIPFHSTNTIKI